MSDKKKRNLIIILCVLAIVIAISAIALAPFGKKATGNSDSPNITESSLLTQTPVPSSSVAESSESSAKATEATDTTFVIPSSTDPVINPNKNYTFFIDKSTFDVTEKADGETILTAKNNSSVKMTVTPVREMGYKECCRAAEKKHKKLDASEKLKIENANSVYRSQTGDSEKDIITTVYCIDDNKGGCIIIECKTPVGATQYAQTIEIMLSMFKVL